MIKDYQRPLLTIITVTFNCASDIEKTLLSIIKHKENFSFEYILIDGNSSDGTKSIIEKYSNKIDYWISENDNGIYNAMNKGWDKANGRYVLFVNAGDIVLHIPFDELNEGFENSTTLICGRIRTNNGITIFPQFNTLLKVRNTLPHQGLFYSNLISDRYNQHFKIFSDFDLNQKLYKRKVSHTIINKVICLHDTGGLSHNRLYFKEVYSIIGNNFGYLFVCISFLSFKLTGLRHKIKTWFL